MKDYYAVLGVDRDASAEEIKKSFRRLARETHPDANPGDAGAEARFREIAEAYEVLSDPKRRAAYDRGDMLGVEGLFSTFAGIEDLLGSFFGGGFGFGGGGRSTRIVRGPDVGVRIEISLEEAAAGVQYPVAFRTTVDCGECRGSGADPDHPPRTCDRCGGSGTVRSVRRTMLGSMSTVGPCDRCRGTGRLVEHRCATCRGEGVVEQKREVTVEIPAGIADGTRLRLTGRGGSAGNAASPGDLYVEVRVLPDPRFRREGDDLIHIVTVGIAEASLGKTVTVPLLAGKQTEVELPAGTQPGAVFHLPREGVPHLRGRGRGDLLVMVEVAVPTELSDEERDALEQYAAARGESPVPSRRRRKKRG